MHPDDPAPGSQGPIATATLPVRAGVPPARPGAARSSTRAGAAWYVARLRAMPMAEVPFRVSEQLRRLSGRIAAGPRIPDALRRQDTGLAELILSWGARPDVRAFWRTQADEVGDGRVTAFGISWPTTPDGVPDWDIDPVTGHRWPDRYCFDVPLRPGRTDVKNVWQLNRLQYLLPVAAHAATSADRYAADLCARHLQRWLDDHHPRRGVVWRSGIELAIRALSMVLILELTATVGADRDRLEWAAARSVLDHRDWLERFPSRYSSANNHRVAELVGLLIIGGAYPAAARPGDVDRWWHELDGLILRQIHPDGVPAEQSTAYATLVLEWLALSAALGPRLGQRFSPQAWRRITAAADFLDAVTDAAGNTVGIGDADESRLLTAALPADQHVRAVTGLVQRHLEPTGEHRHADIRCFAAGGYTVARTGESDGEALWVLDHGPLGFENLAAHAHADTLAVYLHCGGRPVFVDAGTFRYQGDAGWRGWFRGTAAHNTLTIGATDSSTPTGPFNWHPRRRARGRLIDVRSAGCGFQICAEHDGYLAGCGVLHRRTLLGAGGGRYRLSDTVTGTEPVPVIWSLLVAPGLTVRESRVGWVISDGGVPLVRVDVPTGWSAHVARGTSDPALGWCAPSYGRLTPAPQLLLRGELGGARTLDVDITLLDAAADVRPY
jgi:hypothetical protein